MKSRTVHSILLLACLALVSSCRTGDPLRKNFVHPPLAMKSRPLWFWNQPLSHGQTLKVMKASKEAGYAGLGILPSYGMTPEYMSREFLEQYHFALHVADSLGMKLYLYDEYYFPSGMAGGNLVKTYPEAVSKRLDMEEFMVMGGQKIDHPLPSGVFLGAVGMDTATFQRIDLTGRVRDNRLKAELPAGPWRVMLFTLNPDSSSGRFHCDYLSPEAVGRFVELTYDKFYSAFPEHFGTTIDYAFYDEPCLRWVEGGRTWTGDFNEKFKAAHGFSPVSLYPALWYDIGPETEAARNQLLGFRAQLYSTGFPKVLNDWCNAHGIRLTGHVDQEEIINPVATCGDLIKAFQYQDIPAVDEIFFYGRSDRIYKVISSAASNYDRPVVATECFGAMGKMTVENLYREAMDQFARGINLMEPHAVWYNDTVDIQPDLSPSGKKFGAALPEFNRYVGRLQCMLQGGSRVADIGVLYPIASLQGSYHFGPGDPGNGGIIPGEADYQDVGRMLSSEVRCDFTFIHPEILDSLCTIEGTRMQLANRVDREEFSVFLIPGSTTIRLSNLQKIKEFYDNGGIVVATSTLPLHAAEPGRDREVRQLVESMFGPDACARKNLLDLTASSQWNSGGFLPAFTVDGRPETAWKPSEDDRDNAWIEIGLGGERPIGSIGLTVPARGLLEGRIVALDSSRKPVWTSGPVRVEGSKEGPANVIIPVNVRQAAAVRIVREPGSAEMTLSGIVLRDPEGRSILDELRRFTRNTNSRGGKAYFIPAPGSSVISQVLDESGLVRDIRFDSIGTLTGGSASYIHKRLNNRDIYFFSNSSDQKVETDLLLRDARSLETWNPVTGEIVPCPTREESHRGNSFARVRLSLGPVESVFLVSDAGK